MRFLFFTLYAPMGSFGEVAVGERRMSWPRPGRSAILGLVAAARGVDRADEATHRRLESGLYYAVRTDAPGRPFIDYHTAQAPKARRGREFATRRQELASDDLNTVLSRREWRTDAFFTVALWPRPGADVDLDDLAAAFERPHYTLHVGRKSAPLGLPLNPAVVDDQNFIDAFGARKPNDQERDVLARIRIDGEMAGTIAYDHEAPGAPVEARVERRRDAIADRGRWQFRDRLEGVVLGDGGGT